MYCRNDGSLIQKNCVFCNSCGTPLPYCQTCAETLEVDELLCATCRDLATNNTIVSPIGKDSRRSAKKHMVLLAGGCLAIIAAVCIATSVFTSNPPLNEFASNLGISSFSEPMYKVSKETTVFGDGTTTIESYSYDSEGRVTDIQTSKEYRVDGDGELHVAEYLEHITYLGDTEIVRDKTVSNAEDESENGTFRKTLRQRLNDHGDAVENEIEEYDGTKAKGTATYEYYQNGVKRSCEFDFSYDKDVGERHLYKHSASTFDESGNPLECYTEYTDGAVNDEFYVRDSDGKLSSITRHHVSGSYEETTTYLYDEFGNATSEIYEDGTKCEYELTFDEEGRILRWYKPQVKQVYDGRSRASGKSITDYQYDDNGNVTYMKYEPYGVDSEEPGDWGFETYKEYMRV